MDINVIGIIVTCLLAWGAWYANNSLNNVPGLKNIINVLIIVLAVYFIWVNLGVRSQTLHVG